MGTKNNPGNFDCYANAKPDEPMFILLGRDPDAPYLVQEWAEIREQPNGPTAKTEEARDCADAMIDWLEKLGKEPRVPWHSKEGTLRGIHAAIQEMYENPSTFYGENPTPAVIQRILALFPDELSAKDSQVSGDA